MEVIVDGWPEEGKDQVLLDEITCKYLQEADCTEDKDECQEIVISSRDGGGGKFINIKTESWSISDNPEELRFIIEDFKKRAGIYE